MTGEEADAFVALEQRVMGLERRIAGMMRAGTVAEVDAAKGTARLNFGTADKPLLGPPTPYSQLAGGVKAHVPVTVGQQMMLMSPNGDWRQGVAVPMTFSDANPSPGSKGDENAISFPLTLLTGNVELTGDLTIKGSLKVSGGAFEHEGKNVGATHEHVGVVKGGALTGPPAA